MKIKIDIDAGIQEEEIIIRCQELTPEIAKMQSVLSEVLNRKANIAFYKGDTRIYLPVEEILFFETESDGIRAHTADDCFEIKYRLYELEELLPRYFMRVSKSTILNTKRIFSIDRNLYASSTVTFRHTHKQVFVSRHYYKMLIEKLDEVRNSN
ncbi:MAG: LytTR family DNA-binding domain-containing protein [Lachnospiraceae bacterium]|nr:LytTR family DNA-binding domain-containing protein [Lachnospiraceae bacterium]